MTTLISTSDVGGGFTLTDELLTVKVPVNVDAAFAAGNTTIDGTLSAGNTAIDGNLITTGNLVVGGSAAWVSSIVGITKLFDIPHPSKEGMRLRHGCLEGPELAVYVRGKSDSHVITLPEYWVDLVDETTITVQLTSTASNQLLHASSVNVHTITVGGDVTAPFYYMVMAERKDVLKLEVEQHA